MSERVPSDPRTACPLKDFWFLHGRGTVSIQEVAKAFDISTEQVRNLVEAGKLVAAGIGDNNSPTRTHLRVERWSVVAWRLNQLEAAGVRPPIQESPQVTWWRSELRAAMLPKEGKRP